ncbi:MAG: PepSY-associated TM helix domain-containing protein [Bacteroidota bacterium]
MSFKKINAWLHLWLGISSGIIVVIVSLTGCIYVFEKEIRSVYEPWRFVKATEQAYLPPSALMESAQPFLGKREKPNSVVYREKGEAATVSSFDRKKGKFTSIYLNPYTGEVQHKVSMNRKTGEGDFDFFRFVLDGHRALWLPYDIGRPIVGVAVLTFVLILISGLILWWPKNLKKANVDKSFKIKWGASFKRVNYDLHNVFGFYSMIFLLIISLTGLVWSFEWYSKSLYWVTSAGKSLPEHRQPSSDTTNLAEFEVSSVDKIYASLKNKENEGIFLSIPKKKEDVISATLYLRAGTFYKADNYYYDQITLKELKGTGPFAGNYADASGADKLRRMNYDIHIGAILGIPGKVIAFFVSLVSASLPITGFMVWLGRKKKKKKKPATGTGRTGTVKRSPNLTITPQATAAMQANS